jgi:hypothetical protein
MKLLRKLRVYSSNPTSGYIHPKEKKAMCQRDICPPVFIAALVTVATKWKRKCPSTDK